MFVFPSHMSLFIGSHRNSESGEGVQAGYKNVRKQHVGQVSTEEWRSCVKMREKNV